MCGLLVLAIVAVIVTVFYAFYVKFAVQMVCRFPYPYEEALRPAFRIVVTSFILTILFDVALRFRDQTAETQLLAKLAGFISGSGVAIYGLSNWVKNPSDVAIGWGRGILVWIVSQVLLFVTVFLIALGLIVIGVNLGS